MLGIKGVHLCCSAPWLSSPQGCPGRGPDTPHPAYDQQLGSKNDKTPTSVNTQVCVCKKILSETSPFISPFPLHAANLLCAVANCCLAGGWGVGMGWMREGKGVGSWGVAITKFLRYCLQVRSKIMSSWCLVVYPVFSLVFYQAAFLQFGNIEGKWNCLYFLLNCYTRFRLGFFFPFLFQLTPEHVLGNNKIIIIIIII